VVHAGGDAAIAIGSALPGIGRLARIAGSVPPVRWGIGRAYDLVARNRHRIGRWLRLEGPACDVPR
jgi:predicted DCC family thiol-disulfide oxidoreductase YuxK